jgi:hypothetical protein
VNPQFNIFVGGSENKLWIQENYRYWALFKIGFVQGPQKLNGGSGKTIHPETIH